jgi:hypothetical protein
MECDLDVSKNTNRINQIRTDLPAGIQITVEDESVYSSYRLLESTIDRLLN